MVSSTMLLSGGDSVGAKQVNLEPGERPSDIYTAVAGLVQEEVDQDAANGNEIAKMFPGKITRKIVKTTVMTNVYGVTFYWSQSPSHGSHQGSLPPTCLLVGPEEFTW